ncbi:peptidase inhibitor family I36 protein [Streptomyces sp. TRM49041]|uniref:peptidase inhibitor family I36 protein n=1 Tax=Streptomyces sp. TRM49041 TaxID=2603216 RepID=UPI00165685C8|nr:peptidase inhibitor family I36 protein [Streptomyces sp. TRM49041]
MNKIGARALRVAAISAASVALVVANTGSASAAQYNGICDAKEVCIYKHTYLNGPWIDHQYADPNYTNNTWTGGGYPSQGTNDEASSLDSWDTNWKVRFFTNAYYGGSWQTLGVYARANTVTYNDQYSSHCWNDGGVSGYAQCDF